MKTFSVQRTIFLHSLHRGSTVSKFSTPSPTNHYNRPFPSSKNSHFQNEAKCKTFLVTKISFSGEKNHFALSLALKQRLRTTLKWPIAYDLS